MTTCKACDERISHGKYCESCLAEKERERVRGIEQKERLQVARDYTTHLLPKKEEPMDEQRNARKPSRLKY
jgi:hypothetical protein